MKGWSKRLLACGAALVVTASAVCFGYTVPEAAAQGDDTLGAENACTGHKLGEINGLPA